MGRTAKYNWRNLFLEFNQGRYKSMVAYATAKGLNYDRMKKEFKKIREQPEGEIRGEKLQSKKDKKRQNKKSNILPPDHAYNRLKKQFLDWPDEKLQAYLSQLEERLDELKAVPEDKQTPELLKEIGRLRRERRAILSDPDPSQKCKARKHGGEPCNNPVERGKKVCWVHGGAPGIGPPLGAKNALKHGAYETIWLDQLDEEEKDLCQSIARDNLLALEEEIMLLTIRERRMLARIARLTGEDFTVVKIKYEKGLGPQGPVDKKDEEHHGTLGQVQIIEQELTKVQDKKLKAIELKHKIETTLPPEDDGSLDGLIRAIEESRRVNGYE